MLTMRSAHQRTFSSNIFFCCSYILNTALRHLQSCRLKHERRRLDCPPRKSRNVSKSACRQRSWINLTLSTSFFPLRFFLVNEMKAWRASTRLGPRLLGLVAGAELVKQAVYQFAAVFQKVAVGRIANLGITACGIDLHRPPWSLPSSSVWTFFGLMPSASDSSKVSRLKNS